MDGSVTMLVQLYVLRLVDNRSQLVFLWLQPVLVWWIGLLLVFCRALPSPSPFTITPLPPFTLATLNHTLATLTLPSPLCLHCHSLAPSPFPPLFFHPFPPCWPSLAPYFPYFTSLSHHSHPCPLLTSGPHPHPHSRKVKGFRVYQSCKLKYLEVNQWEGEGLRVWGWEWRWRWRWRWSEGDMKEKRGGGG